MTKWYETPSVIWSFPSYKFVSLVHFTLLLLRFFRLQSTHVGIVFANSDKQVGNRFVYHSMFHWGIKMGWTSFDPQTFDLWPLTSGHSTPVTFDPQKPYDTWPLRQMTPNDIWPPVTFDPQWHLTPRRLTSSDVWPPDVWPPDVWPPGTFDPQTFDPQTFDPQTFDPQTFDP